VVLPETHCEGAVALSERLRQVIDSQPFRYEDKTYNVTISLGVAITSGDDTMTPTSLLRLADEKLYQAKNEGRNRVCS
jgi:diguanylate cyclase (GGDEF)-like protein